MSILGEIFGGNTSFDRFTELWSVSRERVGLVVYSFFKMFTKPKWQIISRISFINFMYGAVIKMCVRLVFFEWIGKKISTFDWHHLTLSKNERLLCMGHARSLIYYCFFKIIKKNLSNKAWSNDFNECDRCGLASVFPH